MEDDQFWAKAAPFPPGLTRRLDALATKVGVVDPDAPVISLVVPGESEAQ